MASLDLVGILDLVPILDFEAILDLVPILHFVGFFIGRPSLIWQTSLFWKLSCIGPSFLFDPYIELNIIFYVSFSQMGFLNRIFFLFCVIIG